MVLPDLLGEGIKGAACLGQSVVNVLVHCSIIWNEAAQVSEALNCSQLVAIDVDLRWVVVYARMWLVQYFGFLQADGEAEGLNCFRETVDYVLESFFCVGQEGAAISKDELL